MLSASHQDLHETHKDLVAMVFPVTLQPLAISLPFAIPAEDRQLR